VPESFAKLDDKELRKYLNFLERELKDADKGKAKTWGKVISMPVFADIMSHFEQEKGPFGKWKVHAKSTQLVWAGVISFRKMQGKVIPLDPDYNDSPLFKQPLVEDARPKRLGGRILQDSGGLRKSIFPIKAGKKTILSRNGWKWYTNAKTKSGFPYAAAHNNDGPRDKLPQRKFMWLSGKGLKNIAKISIDHLTNKKVK